VQACNILIFDLDGTLVDTRPQTFNCVNYALAQINESPLSKGVISKSIGLTLEDTFRAILPLSKHEHIDQCVRLYRNYQRDFPDKAFMDVKLYPTVQETLSQLVASNFVLSIATSKPSSLANQILKLQKIDHFFSTIAGVDSVLNNKPAPDMIDLILSRLGRKGEGMMVGDTVADVQSGKNAQVWTCAVEYGYTSKRLLAESQPDFFISSFHKILDILDTINKQK